MRSEGSSFRSGGEAAFAKNCVCDRNRRQPSPTVCGDAVRHFFLRECNWSGAESVSSYHVTQHFWRLNDLCRRSYFGVFRGSVSASEVCCRSYFGVCGGGLSVSDLCRPSDIGVLQKRCHCEGSIFLAFPKEVSV